MKKTILVTGDCVCDHNFYKGNRPTADSSEKPGFRVTEDCGGALLLKKLIAAIMQDTEWRTEFGRGPDFKTLPSDYHAYCFWEPQVANSQEKDPKKHFDVWRAVEPPFGYGHPGDKPPAGSCGNTCWEAMGAKPQPQLESPEIVVIDDAGLGFRKAAAKGQWPFIPASRERQDPRWVVMKLTGTIGEGDLWKEIVARCEKKKNLVLIVSADQLRRNEIRVSRGLSWEATVEDLVTELQNNSLLKPLLVAGHLIVTFSSDGAFWLDNRGEARSSLLVFDAARAEGEWTENQGQGTVFGFLTCFTAAIVRELCCAVNEDKPDLEAALSVGLEASRILRWLGHGPVKITKKTNDDLEEKIDNKHPGFPLYAIVSKINNLNALVTGGKLQEYYEPDEEPNSLTKGASSHSSPLFPVTSITASICATKEKFVSALIPQEERTRGSWMMLDEWQVNARNMDKARPHYEAALAVAVLGPEVLERFPVAQFGNYQTVDRKEIESLRTIRQLIVNYVKDRRPRAPLNLGVFGPPGSGKSYIVYQIAKAANIPKDDVLLFNLSQFKDSAEICGALHRVRDKVLKGVTPLVFWDEFDSGGYKWLQFLLAPMEDGEFQDGQITHPLGNCIFAFAGATASTFAEFGPIIPNKLANDVQEKLEKTKKLEALQDAWKAFVLAKGPDFKSRVVAYLNLLGMNRRQVCTEEGGRRKWAEDPTDLCFPIRRALFMRSLFDLHKGESLKLDLHVVRALLEISEYKGAGRSLQFLCTQLKSAVGRSSGRSSMPSPELLSMHVDVERFWELCEQDADFVPKAAELARLLHQGYRQRTKTNVEKKDVQVEFESLPEDLQKANVAQALRIPAILRLAGMRLEKGDVVPFKKLIESRRPGDKPLRQHLAEKARLEVLAEAEHNGWMVERMISGWKFSRKKDKPKKLHDCLIPYSQLTDEIKSYDRMTITGKAAPSGNPKDEQFGYVDMVKVVGLRVVRDEEKPLPARKS